MVMNRCTAVRMFSAIGLSAAALLPSMATVAAAKNLDALVKFTYAAYLADQESSVCAASRLDFAAEDIRAFKKAKYYAQSIKQKIGERLSPEEGRQVLVAAADRARRDARGAITTFRSDDDVFRWCTLSVVPLVNRVVGDYERDRNEIDRVILKAQEQD